MLHCAARTDRMHFLAACSRHHAEITTDFPRGPGRADPAPSSRDLDEDLCKAALMRVVAVLVLAWCACRVECRQEAGDKVGGEYASLCSECYVLAHHTHVLQRCFLGLCSCLQQKKLLLSPVMVSLGTRWCTTR